jgi:hypothetical protein
VDAYRKAPALLSVAPPAPWWRLLRAWAGGTLKRLHAARLRRGWAVYWRTLDSYDRADTLGRVSYWSDVTAARVALWSTGTPNQSKLPPAPMSLPLPLPPLPVPGRGRPFRR